MLIHALFNVCADHKSFVRVVKLQPKFIVTGARQSLNLLTHVFLFSLIRKSSGHNVNLCSRMTECVVFRYQVTEYAE